MDVVKHNSLIDAYWNDNFSTFDQQFIAECISRISMHDKDFKDMRIDVGNLYEEINGYRLWGSRQLKVYEEIKSLAQKTITIVDHNDERTFPWFTMVHYNSEERIFIVEFNRSLFKYLLQLDKNFTKIKIKTYRLMDDTYGIKLLELMSKIYGKVNQRKYSILELRRTFNLEGRYNKYYDFKRYVLLPAVAEVNRVADFHLDFEQVRTGRTVTHIKFVKRCE